MSVSTTQSTANRVSNDRSLNVTVGKTITSLMASTSTPLIPTTATMPPIGGHSLALPLRASYWPQTCPPITYRLISVNTIANTDRPIAPKPIDSSSDRKSSSGQKERPILPKGNRKQVLSSRNVKTRETPIVSRRLMSPSIVVNDIFEELSEENKRLTDEISLAKKCLNSLIEFKIFIEDLSRKFKPILNSKELQKFECLNKKVNQIVFNMNVETIDYRKQSDEVVVMNEDIAEEVCEESVIELDNENIAKKSQKAEEPIKRFKLKRSANSRDRTFVCHIDGCNTHFRSYYYLQKHQKQFHRRFLLKRPYVRTHSSVANVNTIRCFRCDQVFDQRANLFKHIRFVHRQRLPDLVFCRIDGCPKGFRSLDYLKFHQKLWHSSHKKTTESTATEVSISRTNTTTTSQTTTPSTESKRKVAITSGNAQSLPQQSINWPQMPLTYQLIPLNSFITGGTTAAIRPIGTQPIVTTVQSVQVMPNKIAIRPIQRPNIIKPQKKRTIWKDRHFACDFCPIENLTYKAFVNHIRSRHPEQPIDTAFHERHGARYVCYVEQCCLGFNTEALFISHMLSEHSIDKPFKCDHSGCGYSSRLSRCLKSHKAVHREQVFRCTVDGCDASFDKRDKLKNHIKFHCSTIACPNEGCDRQFKTKSYLTFHIQSAHSDRTKYRCDWPGCEYSSSTEKQLLVHQKAHNEGKYECDVDGCGERFGRLPQLNVHKRTIHRLVKMFRCDWPGCDYTSSVKENTRRHYIRRHESTQSEPQYECDVDGCGKRFRRMALLDDHKRTTHRMGKELRCEWPECEYSAYRRGQMKNHMFSHTTGGPLECPECGKRVRTKKSLGEHIDAIHRKVKPYSCPVSGCPYRTAHKRNISQHMRTHRKK